MHTSSAVSSSPPNVIHTHFSLSTVRRNAIYKPLVCANYVTTNILHSCHQQRILIILAKLKSLLVSHIVMCFCCIRTVHNLFRTKTAHLPWPDHSDIYNTHIIYTYTGVRCFSLWSVKHDSLHFMFCWPYILARCWVNDQLDAQLRYMIPLLL